MKEARQNECMLLDFHSCKILVNVNLYQLRRSVVYWSPGFGFVVGERREGWLKGHRNFGYGNTHSI